MQLRAILLCLVFAASGLHAQDTGPVALPFVTNPVPAEHDRGGVPSGFLTDLAKLLGEEANVPLDYLDADSPENFFEAQTEGYAEAIAIGDGFSPTLMTIVFSEPISTEALQLSVLDGQADSFGPGPPMDKRIGIVPATLGARENGILENNTVVEYADPKAAVMGLLSQDIDALLLANSTVYAIARNAGGDGRIRFVGPTLRKIERVVALHKSRKGLRQPVNDAISRLEASGELGALLARYNMSVPEPPPDIFTVGVTHFPPHLIRGDDGTWSGFMVESMRDIAERSDLQISLHEVSPTNLVKGPDAAGVDMVAGLVNTAARREKMDFTHPIRPIHIWAVLPVDDARTVDTLRDLSDLSLGALEGSIVETVARDSGFPDIAGHESNEAGLEALLAGQIGAYLTVSGSFAELARSVSGLERLKIAPNPVHEIETSIALRFGLGSVRNTLNTVIPAYLLTEQYAALYMKYYGEPVFWTRTRIAVVMLVPVFVLLLVLLATRSRNVRERANAAAAVSSVRDELETIFNAASSGIVALDSAGTVVRINKRARRFLGDITDPAPFAWPVWVRFMDAESHKPLDHQADPVRRALAGHTLGGATHLMQCSDGDEETRYVRVGNAAPESLGSGIETVLVIDDVTNEERNRQAMERKGRLDALGQLTGGIAHYFNNLLASQLYAVDLARRSDNEERRDEYLGIAAGSIEQGRALTSRLLSFAKRQPGLSSVKRTRDVFENFEKLVRPMLEANVDIRLQLDDPEILHFCDQSQLETALMNLVLNSRDAIIRSGKGTLVELRARAVRAADKSLDSRQNGFADTLTTDTPASFRYVEISVSDNGPGMDEGTLARCTDPFFTTKDSSSGSGLGLAMVYGFVRQSEGELVVLSEEGVGTTVRMLLPCGTQAGLREMQVPEILPRRGHGETLLVVEDEARLLEIITALLSDMGYRVITAKTARAAMAVVGDGAVFDLLLTDVVMPGGYGGFELARRVRECRPDVPVIYMSGYTGFTRSEMGHVQAPLLQKPVAPVELAEALSRALQKPG